jgi:hypothetical protein
MMSFEEELGVESGSRCFLDEERSLFGAFGLLIVLHHLIDTYSNRVPPSNRHLF